MTIARNLAGFAANTNISGTLSSGQINTPLLAFPDNTSISTAPKWNRIYEQTITSTNGSSEFALTDNTITYGQYSQIEIVGSFKLPTYWNGRSGLTTVGYVKDVNNNLLGFKYNTLTVSGSSSNGATYTSGYELWICGGSSYTNSPELRVRWTIYCPSTSNMWFESMMHAAGSSSESQTISSGGNTDYSVMPNSTVYRPYLRVYGIDGSGWNGHWEVYGMSR